MDAIWSAKPLLERKADSHSWLSLPHRHSFWKKEVALSCHNYTIPRHILENARKNKLSCFEYIASSSPFTVSEGDMRFVMFQPLHALVFSLSSRLPHRLTCVYRRIQQICLVNQLFAKKNQFQRSNWKWQEVEILGLRGFMLLKYFQWNISGTFDLKH